MWAQKKYPRRGPGPSHRLGINDGTLGDWLDRRPSWSTPRVVHQTSVTRGTKMPLRTRLKSWLDRMLLDAYSLDRDGQGNTVMRVRMWAAHPDSDGMTFKLSDPPSPVVDDPGVWPLRPAGLDACPSESVPTTLWEGRRQTATSPHRCTCTPSSAKRAAFASSALSALSESGA